MGRQVGRPQIFSLGMIPPKANGWIHDGKKIFLVETIEVILRGFCCWFSRVSYSKWTLWNDQA